MAKKAPTPESIEAIALRIEQLMGALDLTISQFADGAGVSRTTISNWLNRRGRPSLDEVIKLVKAYQITIDYIYLGRWDGLPVHIAQRLSQHNVGEAA